MNTDNEKFPEQEAPLKNTDHAFVQVGKDGHPVMPQTAKDETSAKENAPVKGGEEQ